jgi:hypothetical protein
MPRIIVQPIDMPQPPQLVIDPRPTLLSNLLSDDDIEDALMRILGRIAHPRVNRLTICIVAELPPRFLGIEALLDADVAGQEVADVGTATFC